MAWFQFNVDTGGQPLNYTSPQHTSARMLKAVTIHWALAPVTSENIVVSLDSGRSSRNDVVLYRLDPAEDSTTDVLLTDINLPFYASDAIRVTYANTDARTVGVQVFFSSGWA